MAILILILTILASIVNLWFHLGPTSRLLAHQDQAPHPKPAERSVEVLLAARNEADNLQRFLPSVLAQTYPKLGVTVVNDNSSDGSDEVLEELSRHSPSLRVVSAFAKTKPGKKAALAQAMSTLESDWILATDADCQPASNAWAEQMQACIDSDTEIVLGFSPYLKKTGWLNSWIRFEALYTAAQYLSAALAGRAYMGVGRNMLYSKHLYERLEGFSAHAHLAGGDDDLLVNGSANATNTKICISPQAWVYSVPLATWQDYFRQKTRHLSVGTAYKFNDQLWLGALAGSHIACFTGLLLLLVLDYWPAALLIYSIRLFASWTRMHQIAARLGENDLSPIYPLLDAGLFLYYVRFSIAALFPTSGKKTW